MRNSHPCSNLISRAAACTLLLSADDEKRLARRVRKGDRVAFDMLVRANLRLVIKVTKPFTRYGNREDVIAEGLLGLVQGIERFDPNRGVRLCTYVSWWIRAFARRYTIANRRIVRPPQTRGSRKVLANLRATQRKLEQSRAGGASAEAVARALDVSVDEVREMEEILGSGDMSLSGLPGSEPHDLPCTSSSPEALSIANEERRIASDTLQGALRSLSERERHVLAGRSLQASPVPLAALGAELGLSNERVRQIHVRGVEKVRAALMAQVA